FAKHFLQQTNEELNKNVRGFSPEVEEIFKKYVWYGNLRELRNVVKRATLLSDGPYIEDRSLPFEIVNFTKLSFEGHPEPVAEPAAVPAPAPSYARHTLGSPGRTIF